MQSSLFLVESQQVENAEEVRFTLERNDHDAGLLGPLRSRSVVLAVLFVPGLQK